MADSDEIKARTDIVDLVSQYVPDLRKSGRNFTARCPFHQENTPSFVVFPDRQTWRCFGACATGGDIFSFVMRIENVDFLGALRLLAARAGVQLQERKPDGPRNPIYSVNEAALRFFRDALLEERGALARAYAAERGLTEEAIVRWGIGYAPSTGDELVRRLEAMGFNQDLLVQAGVATRGDSGAVRDMFRGRLIFALRDPDGRIVGFAGRSLDGSNPKYLNTPQTAVFDKGRVLYGLDRAKDAIGREGIAVVVEGYMDVITAHEHGFGNVVASMGTALTEHQVALLKGRAPRIVLALDADAAGQEAMLRSLHTSWQLMGTETAGSRRGGMLQRGSDLDVLRIAVLAEGKDPDELIRKDPSRWRRTIAEAVPVVDFLLTAETQRMDISTAEGKAAAAEALMPLVFAINNWAEQDRYFQKLADLLGVSTSTLEAGFGRRRRPLRRSSRQDAGLSRNSGPAEEVFRYADRDALDEYVLALVVRYPDLLERVGEVNPDYLKRPENRAVLSALAQAGTIEGAHSQLDGQLAEHLARISARVLPESDRRQRIADWEACLRRLEERYLRELKVQESVALTQGSADDSSTHDPEYLDVIHRQALATNERLRRLFASGSGAP